LSNTRDRRLGAAGGVPIHSVYGADDSIRHEQQPSQLLEQQPAERGSLPNLDELSSQPLQMHREEAARLASQRRQEAQKQLEEEELLRQNPLRYLLHPRLRVRNLLLEMIMQYCNAFPELADPMESAHFVGSGQCTALLLLSPFALWQ
jgi:hypothetical protein